MQSNEALSDMTFSRRTRILGLKPPTVSVPTGALGLQRMYSNVIRSLADGECSLYGVNVELPEDLVAPVLKDFPLNTSPTFNPRVGRMPGVNESAFFVGWPRSSSCMHYEDSHMDSINVHRGGAPKVWIVVARSDAQLLDSKLSDWLGCAAIDIARMWRCGACPSPLKHKTLFITPEQLLAWGVMFEIFIQQPGDAVWVADGAPHQVINPDFSCSEALNPGWPVWNRFADATSKCGCPNCRYERERGKNLLCSDSCFPFFSFRYELIPSNPCVVVHAKQKEVPVYNCDHEGCGASFLYRHQFVRHAPSHFTGGESEEGDNSVVSSIEASPSLRSARSFRPVAFECPHCSKAYSYKSSLRRHLLDCNQEKQRCKKCNVLLKTRSFLKHECVPTASLLCECNLYFATMAAKISHQKYACRAVSISALPFFSFFYIFIYYFFSFCSVPSLKLRRLELPK